MIPAHTAVIIPGTGDEPEATAIDIDNGIETKATVKPDFQFSLNVLKNKPTELCIKIQKLKNNHLILYLRI
jgi:hypothetical protein